METKHKTLTVHDLLKILDILEGKDSFIIQQKGKESKPWYISSIIEHDGEVLDLSINISDKKNESITVAYLKELLSNYDTEQTVRTFIYQ